MSAVSTTPKLTPAQQRVMDRFREAKFLPAHPFYWHPNDTLPLRALIRRGLIKHLIGPYENHYVRCIQPR